MNKADCKKKTVPELKQMCKEKGISGYSRMSKGTLIDKCCLTAPKALTELSSADERYRMDLLGVVEKKLQKVSELTEAYKASTGSLFTLQNNRYEKSSPKYGTECTFYWNEPRVVCEEIYSFRNSVALGYKSNKGMLCHYSVAKSRYGQGQGLDVCLRSDGLLFKDLNEKEMARAGSLDIDFWKGETALLTLETTNGMLDDFVPKLKRLKTELETKRSRVLGSLEKWEEV